MYTEGSRGDVALESVKIAFREKDNILDKIYEDKTIYGKRTL